MALPLDRKGATCCFQWRLIPTPLVMLRRKALRQILFVSGSLAAIGSSATAWTYTQLNKTPDWPLLLRHQDLLADLTELILPATDTLGAKAAGVPAYVAHMVQKGLDVKSQNNFINGLTEVSEYCRSNFGKPFRQTTHDQRIQTLTHFEYKARSFNNLTTKARNLLIGKPFFLTLRDLTIIGYCTSEPGATQGLAYDYVPGAHMACLPYVKGQKSWSTQ